MANEPNKPTWQATTEPKAVDVTTWGISVLGQQCIDTWYGFVTKEGFIMSLHMVAYEYLQ